MGKSRFIELMAKKMDGSATEAELTELQFFLDQHQANKKFEALTNALTGTLKNDREGLSETAINNSLSDLWVKIKNQEQVDALPPEVNVKPIGRNFKWLGLAAAIAVFAIGGLWFYKQIAIKAQTEAVVIKKVDVPYGSLAQVSLPDGTTVKLNAGSHFSYPSAFVGSQREVTLEGEGFFEVTKNAKKPFLVHTEGFTVRVLGTVFNVKAYRGDKSTETTLLKGKVQVELKDDPDKKLILAPHEKLTINNRQYTGKQQTPAITGKVKYELSTLPVTAGDTYVENAWTVNKIMFANSAFEDVALQIARKYNIHMVFTDEKLKKEQISGVLENESLETALNYLKQIVDLRTKTGGDTVYLAYKTKR
ncbi:FecR family protein [Mucilaginibacter oryzae]|uniref:FecR family protein n=1 Tax=Mucilaginibacter oryzae TaxID=468058 RepID=A0A316HXY5_9SPHI|nr:FecR domain-containing protein [Mucilaginibacter oryzae]PWK79902.1 FecR family protein [Mucilaginibacter oryzae]